MKCKVVSSSSFWKGKTRSLQEYLGAWLYGVKCVGRVWVGERVWDGDLKSVKMKLKIMKWDVGVSFGYDEWKT